MAYDLASIITRVTQKLDDTSFDTTTLISFANDTEQEIYNRYRINQNEAQNDTITTTAASRALSNLPTPPAVQTYISFRIILPVNYSMVIPYVDYEDADVYYPNYQLLGQGPPMAWFIFDGVPTLLNNADKTYTLSAKYVANPASLTATSDTPAVPQENSEALVLGMYARALEFNDEFAQAQTIRQQFHQLCVDYVDSTRRQAGVPHTLRRPRTLRGPIGTR